MKAISSTVTTRPRYLHSEGICRECGRVQNGTQELFTFLLGAQGSPHRRGFRVRVGGGQQQLRLMCPQGAGGFRTRGPTLETSLGQALGGQPKPLAVEL